MSGTNPFRRNIASNLNPLQIQSQAAGQAEERLGAKVYPLNTGKRLSVRQNALLF